MKYMGSKLRIASYICQYINDIAFNENITEYYEPFMGGCSIGERVRIKNRHLSDLNIQMVELMKKVQEGMWEFRYIDREEWYKMKADRWDMKIYPIWMHGWASVGCSWRGRCYEAHGGKYIDSLTGKEINPQLQVYNSLCAERHMLEGIDFQHREYNQIGDVKGSIIYCDAPYRNVKGYDMLHDEFDFDAYDEWLIRMSKDNLVLISEYSMMGKHVKDFVQLEEWTLNKSIGSGNAFNETTVERLYYVKDGWLTDKYFNNNADEELEF